MGATVSLPMLYSSRPLTFSGTCAIYCLFHTFSFTLFTSISLSAFKQCRSSTLKKKKYQLHSPLQLLSSQSFIFLLPVKLPENVPTLTIPTSSVPTHPSLTRSLDSAPTFALNLFLIRSSMTSKSVDPRWLYSCHLAWLLNGIHKDSLPPVRLSCHGFPSTVLSWFPFCLIMSCLVFLFDWLGFLQVLPSLPDY